MASSLDCFLFGGVFLGGGGGRSMVLVFFCLVGFGVWWFGWVFFAKG